MAAVVAPVAGQKRGPGRPPKIETPLAKKARLSTSSAVLASPAVQSPSTETPTSTRRSNKLPIRLHDTRPLPTLSQPQKSPLSDSEYQSLADSGVLAASLTRSQQRWTHDGIFERYWTAPEKGKNARPPPANNPDVKWMKSKGECRIRIEPHIFECNMYVEEKPRVMQAVPQKVGYAGGYGQPYRPGQYGAQQSYQGQALAPMQQHSGGRMPAASNNLPAQAAAQPTSSAGSQQANGKKPDPVITKLAARASSDPELKALMREVATGLASQDQLKIFQKHIDELQKQIQEEKAAEDAREAALEKQRQLAATVQPKEEVIQYDGPTSRTGTPTPIQQQQAQAQYHAQQQAQAHRQNHPAYQPYAPQQQTYAPPPPQEYPVILQFTTPGATEDRFLFPRYSILERLSPHHWLASFIITRRGSQAIDASNGIGGALDPMKEYWQPVTMMLEVKVGLEELPGHVRRWVKPADEVRKHMEETMARCEQAPMGFLALRLPIKGSAAAADSEKESVDGVSKEGTPVSTVEEKGKKSNVKYVKKAPASALKSATSAPLVDKKGRNEKEGGERDGDGPVTPAADIATNAGGNKGDESNIMAGDGPQNDTTESGRPRRTMRKSVRISEG
jgi:hypothetical protein